MCAINPKFKRTFKLEVFTSHGMSEEQFDKRVLTAVLKTEIRLNKRGDLRWHVTQLPDQAEKFGVWHPGRLRKSIRILGQPNSSQRLAMLPTLEKLIDQNPDIKVPERTEILLKYINLPL